MVKKYAALSIVIVFLLAIILFQVRLSIDQNDGHFIYPLDDTYIHLVMAKNLAQHGIWGVSSHAFSSSSSSLLYTLFLGGVIFIFGVGEYIPLILNMVGAVLIYVLLWRICIREKVKPITFVIIAFLSIILTPIPALAISGMEHIFQVLIDFWLIYFAINLLQEEKITKRQLFMLCLSAVLCVMIRFEGLFIVAAIAFFFLLKKRFVNAFLLILSASLPVVVYGIISVKNGAFFFTNSLLIKGDMPAGDLYSFLRFPFNWVPKLFGDQHILMMFLLLSFSALVTYIRDRNLFKKSTLWPSITLVVLLLHLTFARTGWFFRYEAYLVFLFIVGIVFTLKDLKIPVFKPFRENAFHFILIALLGLIFCYPFFLRGKNAFSITVPATTDVYSQQYQMALFLRKYFNTAEVAANDIGAISYFTNIKLLDLVGLASNEPVVLKRSNSFDKGNIEKLVESKGVKIVMISPNGFYGIVPDSWRKAGEWRLENTYVLGSDTVAFYATDDESEERLKQKLRDFSSSLPKQVIQSGAYLE